MDTNQNKVAIKIKCTQREDEEAVEMFGDETVKDLKHRLLRAWPLRWPRARTAADIRFIFLGKELMDQELLQGLKARSKMDAVAIHMVVRERAEGESPSSPAFRGTPTVHYEGSPIRRPDFSVPVTPLSPDAAATPPTTPADVPQQCDGDHAGEMQEADVHFHAVTVSEKELDEFRQIFERKKGRDGRIAAPAVRQVLQSYWRFIHREGFEPGPAAAFPEHRLDQLRAKVGASGVDEGLTLEQFLAVFYLFDNPVTEDACPHGSRERVRIATAQLHSVLAPELDFQHDRFEEVFRVVCGDENGGSLTCREMELLYYMYSARVLEHQREARVVARVQAIVRMRIQSNKYKELLSAARTLQCAWRMRMFVSDRRNHERVADFLRAFMTPTDKPGRPF